MTERVTSLLVQAKATAKIYRSLAHRLVLCADSLEEASGSEWSFLPTLDIEDMTRAISAGILLKTLIQQARK
jgi:hypothetical protein